MAVQIRYRVRRLRKINPGKLNHGSAGGAPLGFGDDLHHRRRPDGPCRLVDWARPQSLIAGTVDVGLVTPVQVKPSTAGAARARRRQQKRSRVLPHVPTLGGGPAGHGYRSYGLTRLPVPPSWLS
jgi:hypothetical protein